MCMPSVCVNVVKVRGVIGPGCLPSTRHRTPIMVNSFNIIQQAENIFTFLFRIETSFLRLQLKKEKKSCYVVSEWLLKAYQVSALNGAFICKGKTYLTFQPIYVPEPNL